MACTRDLLALGSVLVCGLSGCAGHAPSTASSTTQADNGPPHDIVPLKELVIVHPTVVTDPVRTSNANRGVWSFRWLMEQLSGNQGLDVATDFVMNWLGTFHPQNAPEVPPGMLTDRPGVDDLIAKWPQLPDGRVDLTQAPFRLLAITNREDLGTNFGDFGEGRFVFGLVDPVSGDNMPMTVIFEYRLPGFPDDPQDDARKRQVWAERFHNLGNYEFGDPQYNQLLENITTGFAKHGGGSSIHQLRTNELALAENPMVHGKPDPGFFWELREWHLGDDGYLHVANVKNTPDGSFNGDPGLAQFILDNASSIADGSIDISQTSGASFLGFETHEQFGATRWAFDNTTPPVTDPLRGQFAMLTCNGCHNAEQPTLPPLVNNVGFYQVSPLVAPSGATDDSAGTERLAPFVTQIDMPRRVEFMQNQLNDATNLGGSTNLNN